MTSSIFPIKYIECGISHVFDVQSFPKVMKPTSTLELKEKKSFDTLEMKINFNMDTPYKTCVLVDGNNKNLCSFRRCKIIQSSSKLLTILNK